MKLNMKKPKAFIEQKNVVHSSPETPKKKLKPENYQPPFNSGDGDFTSRKDKKLGKRKFTNNSKRTQVLHLEETVSKKSTNKKKNFPNSTVSICEPQFHKGAKAFLDNKTMDVKNEKHKGKGQSNLKEIALRENITVVTNPKQKKKKKMKKKLNKSSTVNNKKIEEIGTTETLGVDNGSDFDLDSYSSDTDDDEAGNKTYFKGTNFADASSSSSSDESDDSQHTFDADSYPSDTEDEEETKKGLPLNAIPSSELEERERRTIFVGNLPYTVERYQLKKWFFKFGKVECVRLRSAPIADPELPRKVAVIKKTFHESRSNIHAYIRFKTFEAAKNALQANGASFYDHIIRVDSSIHVGKYDANKGVFIGNVPFSMEEDGIRNFFSECGDIDSVRIVRDKNTGIGKGFAYINFKCSTSVPLALKLDGEILLKRALRVKPIKYQKKNAKTFLKKPPPQYHSKKFYKKPKDYDKSQKTIKFQGEFAQPRTKKHTKKKSAEERKREKYSKILRNRTNKN